MISVRLGAVGYLNARPLVYGLERSRRFSLRYDLPSECARLLQAGEIDLGLVPSIEYLRDDAYRIVPDLAITSHGPVTSVALYTRCPIRDVRSIVIDAGSRTSVALVRVLCARLFHIQPAIEAQAPDLTVMLGRGDAALIIGDNALLWNPDGIAKIDLGAAWTLMTGLPFVWAFWMGRVGALGCDDVAALQAARDGGITNTDTVVRGYFRDVPKYYDVGVQYLRDNIQYYLGSDERAGLELFYRYAVEAGVVPSRRDLFFYRR